MTRIGIWAALVLLAASPVAHAQNATLGDRVPVFSNRESGFQDQIGGNRRADRPEPKSVQTAPPNQPGVTPSTLSGEIRR